MQFLDCKITLSFSNQKIKDRSETLINKGMYEVKFKFIVSLILSNYWQYFFLHDSFFGWYFPQFHNIEHVKLFQKVM